MQGEVWPASISSVWAQSSLVDSNRKRSPYSAQCKASCIGCLHPEVESRWIKQPSALWGTPADGFFNPFFDSASASTGGRARHICRLGRHEAHNRSMPYSSHRGDRTAPGGVAAMHVHEALSSNYPS